MKEILDMSDEEIQEYLIQTNNEYEEYNNNLYNLSVLENDMDMDNRSSYDSIYRMRELSSKNAKILSLMDRKEEILNSMRTDSMEFQDKVYECKMNYEMQYEDKIKGIYDVINDRNK